MVGTKTKSILVIDDERIFTFLLGEELSDLDCEVKVAYSAENALREVEKKNFDVVITDVDLPGMNGLEFISAARELNPSCKFIVMTGYKIHKIEQKIERLGVFGFLHKPIPADKMKSLVKKH